jgi:hypothetical protein
MMKKWHRLDDRNNVGRLRKKLKANKELGKER